MPETQEQKLCRADESVASRFLLSWNATTSRWGVLADLVIAAGIAAVGGFFLALAAHFGLVILAWVLGVLTLSPLLACIVLNLALLGARKKVVRWLAAQPFPVENMNAMLAGFGEEFEIYFEGKAPERDTVMAQFEKVSDDVFVLSIDEEQQMVRARLGVIDKKHNPASSSHQRYARFLQVVDCGLGKLHAEHPIKRVLVV